MTPEELVKFYNPNKSETPTTIGVSDNYDPLRGKTPMSNVQDLARSFAHEQMLYGAQPQNAGFYTKDEIESLDEQGVVLSGDKSKEELLQERAENQSGINKLWRGLERAVVSELGLGTVISFLDIANFLYEKSGLKKAITNDEGSYSNKTIDYFTNLQQQFRDYTPIYRDNPNKSFDFGDPGWWAENEESLVSSLTLLLPTKAIGWGAGKIARMTRLSSEVNELGNITKAGRIRSSMEKIGAYTKSKNYSKTAKLFTPRAIEIEKDALEIGAGGFLMRTMENYQEARGVYNDMLPKSQEYINNLSDDEYRKMLEENINYYNQEDKDDESQFYKDALEGKNSRDDVAKHITKEAADHDFAQNYWNVIFDIWQLHALRNVWKSKREIGVRDIENNRASARRTKAYATGTAETELDEAAKLTGWQSAKQYTKDYLKANAELVLAESSEGLEEAWNYISQQEGMYLGNFLLDKSKYKSRDSRYRDYMNDPHLWESAFWGWIGGMIFEGSVNAYHYFKNGNINSEAIETQQAEYLNKFKKFSENISLIRQNKDPFHVHRNPDGTETNIDLTSEEEKEEAMRIAREQYVTELAIKHQNAGSGKLLKDYIQSDDMAEAFATLEIENKETATAEDFRIAREKAKQYQRDIVRTVKEVEDLYQTELIRLDERFVNTDLAKMMIMRNVRAELGIKELQRDLDKVNKEIDIANLPSEYLRYAQLAEYRDRVQKIQILKNEIAYLEKQPESTDRTVSLRNLDRQLEQQSKKLEELVGSNTRDDSFLYALSQMDIDVSRNMQGELIRDPKGNINIWGEYHTKKSIEILNKYAEETQSDTETKDEAYIRVRNDFELFREAQRNAIDNINDLDNKKARSNIARKIRLQQSIEELQGSKIETDKQIETFRQDVFHTFDDQLRELANSYLDIVKDLMKKYDPLKVRDYFMNDSDDSSIFSSDEIDKIEKAKDMFNLALERNEGLYNAVDELMFESIREKLNPSEGTTGGSPSPITVAPTGGTSSSIIVPATPVVSSAPETPSTGVSEATHSPVTVPVVTLVPTPVITPETTVSTVLVTAPEEAPASTLSKDEDGSIKVISDDYLKQKYRDEINSATKIEDDAERTNSYSAMRDRLDAEFDELVAHLIKSGYSEEASKKQATKTIKTFKTFYARNIGDKSLVSTVLTSAITEVYLNQDDYFRSDISVFNKEYVDSLNRLLKTYLHESKEGIISNGKTYINLENVLRYIREHIDQKDLIDMTFNNIKEYLKWQQNNNGEYVITDANNLDDSKFLDNVKKTAEERLADLSMPIRDQSIDFESVRFGLDKESKDKFDKALSSLKLGDELQISSDKDYVYFSKDGVKIARIPLPKISADGKFMMRNDFLLYDIAEVNSDSRLYNVFKNVLTDDAYKDFRDKLYDLAFNPNTTIKSEDIYLSEDFNNTFGAFVIYGERDNLTIEEASDLALDGILKVIRYVQNAPKTKVSASRMLTNWFNKLNSSYTAAYAMASDNKVVTVSQVPNRELRKKPYVPGGPSNLSNIQDVITDEVEFKVGIVSDSPNMVHVDGSKQPIRHIGMDGTPYGVIKNGDEIEFVTFFTRPVNELESSSDISKIIQAIEAKIKEYADNRITKVANNTGLSTVSEDELNQAFSQLANFIESAFARSKSIFDGIYINKQNDKIIIGFGKTGHQLTIFKQDKTVRGKHVNRISLNGTVQDITDSKPITDFIHEMMQHQSITTRLNKVFIKNSTDGFPIANTLVSFENNKFTITVDDQKFEYDSYSDFLVKANAFKTNLEKVDGSNFRPIGYAQFYHKNLIVSVNDKVSTPVEESTPTASSVTIDNLNNIKNSIIDILNNNKIKNKGVAIYEYILGTDEELNNLKKLGILPKNIIFAADGNDNTEENRKKYNGVSPDSVNCYYDPADGNVYITPKFFELVKDDKEQAVRKLIHEQIHKLVHDGYNKNKVQLNNLYSIFTEFTDIVNSLNDTDKKNISPYTYGLTSEQFNKLDDNSKMRIINEFLAESLTSKVLADFLNNTKSKDSVNETKKPTFFQKIVNALLKLLNINNINTDSLYAKEYYYLSTKLNKSKDTVRKERKKAVVKKTDDSSQLTLNFDEDNSENPDTEVLDESKEDSEKIAREMLDTETKSQGLEAIDDEAELSAITEPIENVSPNLASFAEYFEGEERLNLMAHVARGEINFRCR